jgi:hypothetical protein
MVGIFTSKKNSAPPRSIEVARRFFYKKGVKNRYAEITVAQFFTIFSTCAPDSVRICTK